MKYKIGDIVSNEFRETYERESHWGVIVEIKDKLYKVVKLWHDKDGEFFFDEQWEWRPENRLTKINKTLDDLGLSI